MQKLKHIDRWHWKRGTDRDVSLDFGTDCWLATATEGHEQVAVGRGPDPRSAMRALDAELERLACPS